MVDIKWEEPPKQLLGRGRTNWSEIASALKSNPEQWAVVAENVSASTGTHIRYGRLKAFEPSGAFEARDASFGVKCLWPCAGDCLP
jgi:hypothetical protein